MTINRITLGKPCGPDDGKNDRHVGTEVLKEHKMAKLPEDGSSPGLAVSPDPTDSTTPDTPPDERGTQVTPDPRNPDA